MTPELAEIIKALGLSAVFLFQVNILYRDLRAQHTEVMAELTQIRTNQAAMVARLVALETLTAFDDPPTKPLRPQ